MCRDGRRGFLRVANAHGLIMAEEWNRDCGVLAIRYRITVQTALLSQKATVDESGDAT